MLTTSLERHIVWHIRVAEVSPYGGPRVERTFRFPDDDRLGALACYRNAVRAGFTVTVHKTYKEVVR